MSDQGGQHPGGVASRPPILGQGLSPNPQQQSSSVSQDRGPWKGGPSPLPQQQQHQQQQQQQQQYYQQQHPFDAQKTLTMNEPKATLPRPIAAASSGPGNVNDFTNSSGAGIGSSKDFYMSYLPQDERILQVWGTNGVIPDSRSTEELEDELKQHPDDSEDDLLFVLCSWTWRGCVEQVLSVLDRDSNRFKSEPFRVLRASLLMKLGRQKEATEIVELLQQSKTIAAKILCAVVTFEWNERSTAVDMLFKLQGQLKQIAENFSLAETQEVSHTLFDTFHEPLTPEAARRWHQQVMALLVSCYATTGNYLVALELCNSALDELSQISLEDDSLGDAASINEAYAPTLLQIARLRLQMGDVEGARCVLEDLQTYDNLNWTNGSGVQVLRGLCEFGEGNMEDAKETFSKLISQVNGPDSPAEDVVQPYSRKDMMSALVDVQEPLAATLANNLALCQLNLCDLEGAMGVLEDCIRANPIRNMHRTLVFNLCTLYDLARSKEQSRQAKLDLQRLAEMLKIGQRFDAQKDLRL